MARKPVLDATIRVAITLPPRPFCGDGIVQIENGETCDPGSGVSNDCPYGAESCKVCTENCQNQDGVATFCGDGVLQPTFEECDSAPRTPKECNYEDPFCEICNHLCQRVSANSPQCGDGVIDSTHGEECDDGNTITETCLYGQNGCTVCNAECQWEAGATEICGDMIISHEEDCEDGNNYTEICDTYNESCTVCTNLCVKQETALSKAAAMASCTIPKKLVTSDQIMATANVPTVFKPALSALKPAKKIGHGPLLW